MYNSLIRPILEYGNILFDDGSITLSQRIESVQYSAARVCTGALLTTSRNNLLQELGWKTLADRRQIHKLTHYYKMTNQLVPSYLHSIVPGRVGDVSRYPLRNARNRSLIASRTSKYKSSFLPSTTVLWNSLQEDVRNSPSLAVFKSKLNFLFPCTSPPCWFFTGSRYANVLHTRFRLDSTLLNCHMFKHGRSDTCACSCGHTNESTKHFFLECPLYATQRTRLLAEIRTRIAPNIHPNMLLTLGQNHLLNILLHGSVEFESDINISIFKSVQYYIISSGRFSNN